MTLRHLCCVFAMLFTIHMVQAQEQKPVSAAEQDSVAPLLPKHYAPSVQPVSLYPVELDSAHKPAPKARRKAHKHFDPREEFLLDSIKHIMRQRVLADTHSTKPDQDADQKADQDKGAPEALLINPKVNRNFEGNLYNGYRPPDNAMAISNSGWMVSAVNSSISYLNENGNIALNSLPLDEFYDQLGLPSYFFDPRVVYDPVGNRFILVVLHGSTPQMSKLVISFSKSDNPNDGWWTYLFDGNFANVNTWFDYPQVGLSAEDVYVAGNLFDSNDNSVESLVLQLDKEQGYAGLSLNFTYWNNIKGASGQNIFSLQPVSGGFGTGYGPGIYLLGSSSSSGSIINLLNITADYGNNPQLLRYSVSCPFYIIGSDADQSGSNKLLKVNDCRMLSAYYSNGIIHYVHHSEYNNTGYNGIRYGRLNVAAKTIVGTTFGLDGYAYTFPVVAPFANAPGTSDVIIGFTRSADNIFPQFRAVTHDGNAFSGSISVKNGNSPIQTSNDNVQRWGDYSSICRRHNATNSAVWVFGCYGKNDQYGNWIAEIVPEGTVAVGATCAEAIPITCGESLSGTTSGAAQQVPECSETLNTAPGRWYQFVGTGEKVRVSTCDLGTDFDTQIGVFRGSCNNLVCVTGNDDDIDCDASSSLDFISTAGTTYYIYVTGFDTESGNYVLSIQCGCAPSPYPADDPIYQQVIAEDDYCCNFEWDNSCQQLYDQLNATCQGNTELNSCSGSIDDGSGSDEYSANLNCTWSIAPPGAAAVRLTFTAFQTESCCDSVTVFDGSDDNAPVLGVFTGSALPPSVKANSGQMFVRFTTDGSVENDGWSANYICCNTLLTPTITPTGNTALCSGQTVTLQASNICAGCTIVWSNGQTGPSISVSNTGTFSVTQTDACGQVRTSNAINVNVLSAPTAPVITAQGSASLCNGQTVTLNASNVCAGCSVMWSNGQSGPSIVVSTPNTYTAVVSNACGQSSASNSVVVTTGTAPSAPLVIPQGSTTLCNGESVVLNASNVCAGCSVVWSNGQSGPGIVVSTPNTYTASVSNACGQSSASNPIVVTTGTTPLAPLVDSQGSTALCNGESVVLTASNVCSGCNISWSNGQTGPSITVSAPNTYTAVVSNSCGQSDVSNSVTVAVQNTPVTPTVVVQGSVYICPGQTSILLVTNTCPGCTVTWSNAQTGDTLIIAAAGIYNAYMSNTCGKGPVSAEVQFVEAPPFTPIVQVNSTCFMAAPSGSNYQWYLNGAALPGATSQFWTAQETGYYGVRMQNPSGCTGESDPLFVQACSINASEPVTGIVMALYPNPATDKLYLALHLPGASNGSFEVFTADGRYTGTLFEGNLLAGEQTLELTLPNLPAGMYAYRFKTEKDYASGVFTVAR